MKEDALNEQLEKYVRGQLSPSEAAALEQNIANDPELQEQLRLHQLELESHEYLLREQLRQNVKKWVAEAPIATRLVQPGLMKKKWPFVLLITAILAVVGIWHFEQNQKKESASPSHQEKAEQTTTPIATTELPIEKVEAPTETLNPPAERRLLALVQSVYKEPQHIGAATLRGTNTSAQSSDPMSAGIRAFQAGRYRLSIKEFDKIKPQADSSQYALALEWQAHAWFKLGLKTGDFSAATGLFQSIADQKTEDIAQDRAEWYLTLCLVAGYPKQKERVDQQLRDIIEQEFHSFREDAITLQEALSRKR